MSCVSKSITEHALRERLTRTIRLGTFERLLSFHRFVFSGDSASRLACVRALILALPPHFMTSLEDCADEVAQLLVGCKRLRYLELHWYDLLTLEDPRLPSIVASLTELRAFDASERPRPTGISPESEAAYINTFTTLQSTLDSLRLPWIYAEDVTFFHDLAISQPCLKELWFSIPKFLPLNTPFRSVSRLHLTLLREYPRIRDIYRAFPSARDIRIGWIPSINLFRLTEADTAARHLAEEDCRDGNVWRSLDLLSSSFQYLCIFALTCPVRRLVLRDLEFGLWFWSDQAVELLSRLRPRQLDVVVDCGTPMDFPVPIDPRMFVNDSGASPYRLAHLCARMWFHPEGGVPDTDNVTDMFRKVLSVSQVELFRLDLYDSVTFINGLPLQTQEPADYHRKLAECMVHINLFAVVRALVDCCPSLRIVVMNLSAEPDERYWRVEMLDGQAVIKEVGRYTGRQMVAEEEERLFSLKEY